MIPIFRKSLMPAVCAGFLSIHAGVVDAADAGPAAAAVNALGVDLLRGTGDGNALLSPYSIQSALAMTYAGSAGETRDEMAKVLHYPADEEALHDSFAALQQALAAVEKKSKEQSERAEKRGGHQEPVTMSVANRLFGQKGYEFRKPFLGLVEGKYQAPLELMDFAKSPDDERKAINRWVEEKTRERIRDLIPPMGITEDTRLVLVNAIYMMAPWQSPFEVGATRPEPFHANGGQAKDVPTMLKEMDMGYARQDDFTMVSLPYAGGELQFVVILPDKIDGLAGLEAKMEPAMLASAARLPKALVRLHLPKMKMEPPVMGLGDALQRLGMKSAFDKPQGSADFDRMAPRKPDDYLFISEVFHKTFLSLDEKGTEAAAATAVVMMRATAAMPEEPAKPIEVKVDRPFLFMIQHADSGACLFLGRMTEP